MAASGPAAGSIETRTSWLIATAAVAILSVSFGAPLIVVVALPSDRGGSRRRASHSGARLLARLSRRRRGRGADGLARRADRHAPGRGRGRRHGLRGPRCSRRAARLGSCCWATGVLVGLLGNGALFPPHDDLCLALVRPAAGHCARPRLLRAVRRRRPLARAVRAGGGRIRLAAHHAGLRPAGRRRDRAARGAGAAAAAAPAAERRPRRRPSAPARRCFACRPTWRCSCWRSPPSCAAFRWRCRRRTSSRSAATSGSPPRAGR